MMCMDIARIPILPTVPNQLILRETFNGIYIWSEDIARIPHVASRSCLTRDKELSDIVWRRIGIHHAVRVACVAVGAARHGGERAKVGPALDVACLTEEGRRLLDKRLDLGLCADGASVEVHAGKLGSAWG
jgi:hypothetical protein